MYINYGCDVKYCAEICNQKGLGNAVGGTLGVDPALRCLYHFVPMPRNGKSEQNAEQLLKLRDAAL